MIKNAPPPPSPVIYGNLQILPRPTENAEVVMINDRRLLQLLVDMDKLYFVVLVFQKANKAVVKYTEKRGIFNQDDYYKLK